MDFIYLQYLSQFCYAFTSGYKRLLDECYKVSFGSLLKTINYVKKFGPITLKHLIIKEEKHIDLQVSANKAIHAIIESQNIFHWNDWLNMYNAPNNKENLNLIFDSFKGIAWINGAHFFEGKKRKIILILFHLNSIANELKLLVNHMSRLRI